MKKAVFLVFCSLSVISHSQNESFVQSSDTWNFSSSLGFATLQSERGFKMNSAVLAGTLSKEFVLSDQFSLMAGLGVFRIKGDCFDTLGIQAHITNDFATIPLGLRYNARIANSTSLFAEVGIYAAYLFESKLETIPSGYSGDYDNLGFNFGLQSSIGFRERITENFSISFGLLSKGDLFESYQNSFNKFKIKDLYAFQLGLGFAL